MRKAFALTSISFLLTLMIAGCGGGGGKTSIQLTPAPTTAAAGRATLTGAVYAPIGVSAPRSSGRQANASATGKDTPVAGASVSVMRMKSDGTLEAVDAGCVGATDDSGNFSIPNVPEEENLVLEATKSISVAGQSKVLNVKKVLSVTEWDADAGAISDIEIDAATTLAVAAMQEIIVTANQGVSESNKIDGKHLPRELLSLIENDIETALIADQAGAVPVVNLESVATDESVQAALLTDLQDSANGAALKERKDKAASKSSLRVHVVEIHDQGPPLQGATVILTANGQVSTATTDDKGNAFFDGIAAGSTIDVEAVKSGYAMARTSQNIDRAALVYNVTVHMEKAASNQTPIAKAGADQTVPRHSEVTLDGSASFDPDGDSIGYAWTQTAGTSVTLSSLTTATPIFTASAEGSFTFSLVVNDGSINSEADTVTIMVTAAACTLDSDCDDGNALTVDTCSNPNTSAAACVNTPNQAPMATAEASVSTGFTPLAVNFTGGCSDSDGTCEAYLWDFGDGSPASSMQNPSHTFTAAGTFTVTLTVTDNRGATSVSNKIISVQTVTWSKFYGGTGTDIAQSTQQTADGGYIVAGHTSSSGAGNYDLWVLKLDSSGNQQWANTYGGNNNDLAYAIQQTTDGGYIVAGETDSSGGGGSDLWVLKLDSTGNQQWANTFGGTGQDKAYSIQQTSDGGYIVAGSYSTSLMNIDFYIVKLDSSGAQQWTQTYGGSDSDAAYSIEQTTDGGYIVAGYSGASYDFWVLKLDSSGAQQWANTYGGSENDVAYSVRQTTDGGYIVAGYSASFGGTSVWILKLNSSGAQQWANTYGGHDAYSIQQTTDGGYIVAGFTLSSGAGADDGWVMKLDSSGNQQWANTYGGTGADFAKSIQQTTDGGYIVAGYTYSYGAGDYDFWALKLDANGMCPGGTGCQ